jgi:hypothetical protein
MYSKVDPLTCAFWAIPSGPRREEGSTHFLVIGPEGIGRWKGPALSKADIDKLEPVPTADVLNVMGMTEQSMIALSWPEIGNVSLLPHALLKLREVGRKLPSLPLVLSQSP